jgi:hypothetical protein
MGRILGIVLAIFLVLISLYAYSEGGKAVADCIATEGPGALCRAYNDSQHVVAFGGFVAAVVSVFMTWPHKN